MHLHDPASSILGEVERAWFAGVERRIVFARPTVGGVLVSLDGVDDRDAAEALKGAPVEVRRADIPLAEGEYLLGDLVGCAAVDEQGAPLGVIEEVLPSAQDLLVVRDEQNERLVPVVPEFVRSVDLAARRVVLALPEDLPVEKVRR